MLSFRELFRDLIGCLMDGVVPYQEFVANFNRYYGEVKQHRSLAMNGYGMQSIWVNTHEQTAFPLWRLVQWSAEFLSSAPGHLIKRCACGNLFIDRSTNGRRRWCSPSNCGARHWSGEYYRRKKVDEGVGVMVKCGKPTKKPR